jgi:hypothetical protein
MQPAQHHVPLTPSVCYAVNDRAQVLPPYKATGNNLVLSTLTG